MRHNQTTFNEKEWKGLIGEELLVSSERGVKSHGKVVGFEVSVDGYGHETVYVITNEIDRNTGSGRKWNLNLFTKPAPAFSEVRTFGPASRMDK